MPTRVRAIEERINLEINFPRLLGYRFDLADRPLDVKFTVESKLALSTREVPTQVQVDGIAGQGAVHTLADLKDRRLQEVAFVLARRTLQEYFRDGDNVKHWYFPQLLDITKRWLRECVTYKDETFPQLLLLTEYSYDAAERIYDAIVRADNDQTKTLVPILRPYDTVGTTRYVDFDTTRPVYVTQEDRCHISHVVADTNTWEQKMAQALEAMPEIRAYAKNQGLGFTIPYTYEGTERGYLPDFLTRVDDGHGPADLLNLIVEVSGEAKKDKAAKRRTVTDFWIPAVNNARTFGRWSYLEITDPWDAQTTIRAHLHGRSPTPPLWATAD
jgi:type III restriction enzyme